jgi:hypothetical protein
MDFANELPIPVPPLNGTRSLLPEMVICALFRAAVPLPEPPGNNRVCPIVEELHRAKTMKPIHVLFILLWINGY